MATAVQIVFDCGDPNKLATFWAAALHYKKRDPAWHTPGRTTPPDRRRGRSDPKDRRPQAPDG